MKTFFTQLPVLVILIVALSGKQTVLGQSDFSFSAGGGAMYYNGDLSDSRILPPVELIKPYYGFDISMLLVDRLDLSLRYLHGKVEGDDATSNERDNRIRNQSFFSPIDEINLMLRVRLFSVSSKRVINPFGMVGLGYFWFNPQAELDGKIYELQPLGTEGQFIGGGEYPSPYNLSSTSFVMGLGVFIRLNNNFGLRIEGAPQVTFTDYLDDVSTSYPDSASLAATPNGAVAVLLANRRTKGGFPPGGRSRGNSDKDDVIVTLGVSLVYTPGKNNQSQSSRPGVFKKIFKGRKGWWGFTPN